MKIIIFLLSIFLMVGCSSEKNEDNNVSNNSDADVQTPQLDTFTNVTEESIRISAYNYITAIEWDVMSMIIEGDIPETYHDASIPMIGISPIKVDVTIRDGKVNSGTIEYEEYIVILENGMIQEVTKK